MNPSSGTHPKYMAVFWGLVGLTLLEVLLASSAVGEILARHVQVLLLIVLAVAKAAMVALYFMHLRYERLLLSLIFLIPLGMSAILVLLTVMDKPFVP